MCNGPYDAELDSLRSYELAIKEIGKRVKAGGSVPAFMLPREGRR